VLKGMRVCMQGCEGGCLCIEAEVWRDVRSFQLNAVLARNKKLEAFVKQAQRKLKLSEDRVTKVLHQNGELAEQLKTCELGLREREKIRLATKQVSQQDE